MTMTIDRTGPMVDDPRWVFPAYPSELERPDEYGLVEKSWLDVRTDEQVEADAWATLQWGRHRTIGWTSRDPAILKAAYWQHELMQMWWWGYTAPSEMHARRLALHLFDWHSMFMRRQSVEEAATLAVEVLRGWVDSGR